MPRIGQGKTDNIAIGHEHGIDDHAADAGLVQSRVQRLIDGGHTLRCPFKGRLAGRARTPERHRGFDAAGNVNKVGHAEIGLQQSGADDGTQEFVHAAEQRQRVSGLEAKQAGAQLSADVVFLQWQQHDLVIPDFNHRCQKVFGFFREAAIELVINNVMKQHGQRLPGVHTCGHVEQVCRGMVFPLALFHRVMDQGCQPLDVLHGHLNRQILEGV